jgi:hypothetical protein
MKSLQNPSTHITETKSPSKSKSTFAVFLVLIALIGIISSNIAFSLLTSYTIIKSTGSISTNQIIAKSGSPQDIQTAVNTVAAAGGGIVYVPEGEFVFNPPQVQWGCAVEVPGGVNVIGAGVDRTILKQTVTTSGLTTYFFGIDGTNGKPSRISGFTLMVTGLSKTEPEDAQTVGICVDDAKDFRIDHINFFNFTNMAIYAGNSRGVIDHCSFDNPYKDDTSVPPEGRIWGYGIVVVGDWTWASDINSLLGHYDDLSTVVYIEDCSFRRCRHCIAANGGAHYVARHNYFTEMILAHYGSYVDAHGGTPSAVGTRCVEIYDNIIEDSPCDARSLSDPQYWGQYLGLGVGIRGGGGVVFNNTIKYCRNGIRLYSDFAYEQTKPKAIWIWNNNFINVENPFDAWQDTISITENVDYFLYAKAGYTPYPYPHPLTLG